MDGLANLQLLDLITPQPTLNLGKELGDQNTLKDKLLDEKKEKKKDDLAELDDLVAAVKEKKDVDSKLKQLHHL